MNGVEKMIISPDVASMYFGMNYGMNLNMRTAPQAPTFSASNVVIDKKI